MRTSHTYAHLNAYITHMQKYMHAYKYLYIQNTERVYKTECVRERAREGESEREIHIHTQLRLHIDP